MSANIASFGQVNIGDSNANVYIGTFVLVTHKQEMLQLVDRVIVVADHRIVMDGPKGEVLARLHGGPVASAQANGPVAAPATVAPGVSA